MSAELLERPLIIGARGQLGSDLVSVLEAYRPLTPDRSEADLEDPDSLTRVFERYRPTIVINAAAFHNVDQCELQPERAMSVNALAVGALAHRCAAAGAAFLTISTDYVFSGMTDRPYREEDRPEPISAYGVSKLAGEFLAKIATRRLFIVRTCGLYGLRGSSGKGYTFADRILEQARRGETLRVVNDVTASPSYTRHVAVAIRAIVESGRFGLYHAVNDGACTWYEFACEVLAQSAISAKIEPISHREYWGKAARPKYSALANEELRRAGLPPIPSWREGLRAYLDARRAAL